MKQTLETRTNEPILWYSSRFVDFGSFEESINYKHKKKKSALNLNLLYLKVTLCMNPLLFPFVEIIF